MDGPRVPDVGLRTLAMALPALSWELRRAGEQRLGLDPLPPSELEIVRWVVDHPGARATDVARGLAIKPSNVSAGVTSLVARGLLERTPDPGDGRVQHLHPTAQAVRDRSMLTAEWAAVLAEAVATLPPDEAEALSAAVGALAHLAEALPDVRRAPSTGL